MNMLKQRIIVETSDENKAALTRALDFQGQTITEWFEDQIGLSVKSKDTPQDKTQLKASDLISSEHVFNDLNSLDWSLTNEDTQYLTHNIHPYPAKFIPQIPSLLISRLSLSGETILDPFGGSGTTATEAVRLGRRAISIDANPLCSLIGKVKSGYLDEKSKSELKHLETAINSYIELSEKEDKNFTSELLEKFSEYIPEIPNIQKWFNDNVLGELALLCSLIENITSDYGQEVAYLNLSRIITRVSNQDSETRYVAKPKETAIGFVLKCYLTNIKAMLGKLELAEKHNQYGCRDFLCGDSREYMGHNLDEGSVDLVVTSPPYPNATDYHLYHRFRLFWLGHDPRKLGKVEIGSHLKHQRKNSGFSEYCNDMHQCLSGIYRVLRSGRFAALVVGDGVFQGETYSTGKALSSISEEIGFEVCGIIDRPIHKTKRSFSSPARRAKSEQILIIKKPSAHKNISLSPPNYKLWPYEKKLREMEIASILNSKNQSYTKLSDFSVSETDLPKLLRLSLSKEININSEASKKTWQAVLENGHSGDNKRRDSKYATHGIHNYKGKFYPQLVKSLINIAGLKEGDSIFDPFCGSGTVPLEAYLNGLKGWGCDMNPLAAKIAAAKTLVLTVDRNIAEAAILSLLDIVNNKHGDFQKDYSEFNSESLDEINNWFPPNVIYKLNWLLKQIRLLGNPVIVSFFEVILSDIIRDVSQQDPRDLRIRRRKEPISDAEVTQLFKKELLKQYEKLRNYWKVASYNPNQTYTPIIVEGDSRLLSTYKLLSLHENSVDTIITSPPYATALPYIDTDRLSLLAIMGIKTSERSRLERELTGSREIRKKEKKELENLIFNPDSNDHLPKSALDCVQYIYNGNDKDETAGFRRQNMPALLWRYFLDMKSVISNAHTLLRPNASAFFVIGDSKTKVGEKEGWYQIETGRILKDIAKISGFETKKLLDISVTQENYKHQKNSITENAIYQFTKKN